MIDLRNLDTPSVLAALYNHSKPLGRGKLQFTPEVMSRNEAEMLMMTQDYFDYLKGRVMKVDLSGNEFDPYLYDRDNGEGAAQRAIDTI